MRSLWRSSVHVDWSKARPVSAVRLTAVMAATLTVAWNVFGPSIAVSASVASLLVGILDRGQSTAVRFRTMSSGTVLLAVTTLITHRLSPWPVAIVGLLILVAFAEGAGIAVHPDAPLVMQLTGFVVATALLEPEAPGAAFTATLAVLAAGAAQTVVSTLVASSARSVLELEVTADAVARVAVATRSVATLAALFPVESEAAAAMEDASRSLSSAQRRLRVSDLDPAERSLLDAALFAADRMRIDAMAVLFQQTEPDPARREAPGEASVRLRGLSEVLDAGSRALRARTPLSGPLLEPDPVALDAADPVAAFTTAIAGIVAVRHWRRQPTRHAGRGDLAQRIRIGAVPLRFGVRLSLASLISAGVGAAAGLVHGSWTINAGLSVLRPDGGATLPRLLLRSGATTIAALVVVLEAIVVGHHPPALAVGALLFACLMYWWGPSNYGFYAGFVTASVLSLFALTASNPRGLAFARWEDTLVGCAVALAVAFVVPVWKVTQLPANVARCCAATASRFRTLATSAGQSPVERDAVALRSSGATTRDAISDVVAILQVAAAEPAAGVPVATLSAVFDDVRNCVRAGVVAEHLLLRGVSPDRVGGGGGRRDGGRARSLGHLARPRRAADG